MNITPTVWENCYESSWKGMITNESFCHPAKFSRDLIERIFAHCLARGYLRKGDLVADCFGGIGTGGIAAAYAGLRWVGVELEPRFVIMAEHNFALHAGRLHTLGRSRPVIMSGDSRKFDELVANAKAVVCSPPYAVINAGAGGLNHKPAKKPGQQTGRSASSPSQVADQHYGSAEGQISNLKDGGVDAVITSPPFTQTGGSGQGINTEGYKGSKGGGDPANVGKRTYQGKNGDRAPENIEMLPAGQIDAVVTSPPFADSLRGMATCGTDTEKSDRKYGPNSQQAMRADYGTQEGQIGRLRSEPIDAVVTSPPWEKNCEGNRKAGKFKNPAAILKCNRGHGASDAAVLAQAARDEKKIYGTSEGQIGQLKGGDVKSLTTTKAEALNDSCLQTGAKKQEGLIGSKQEIERLNETDTNASIAQREKTCTSTTSKQIKKQEGAGTTHSKTSLHCAERVTHGGTQEQGQPENTPAFSAGEHSSQEAESACSVEGMNAGEDISEKKCKRSGQRAETYWEAVSKVYRSCYLSLKPGGVIVLVCKDYVKAGKRVPLCDDTARLLEHLGFTVIERIHAMLVKETEHNDLFNGATRTKTERKSFFRRLAEKKGSPPINYEEVVIAKKP